MVAAHTKSALAEAAAETSISPEAVFDKVPSKVTKEDREAFITFSRAERAHWIENQDNKGKDE